MSADDPQDRPVVEVTIDVSPPKCDARIRPFPHDLELMCRRDLHTDDPLHETVIKDYAFPGSRTVLSWLESDRRTFRGAWIECPQRGCILPCGHRGDHA